jgi:hypothetical protein
MWSVVSSQLIKIEMKLVFININICLQYDQHILMHNSKYIFENYFKSSIK